MALISYVFKSGRKEDYLNDTVRAKDFFYGLYSFKNKNVIQIFEFTKASKQHSFFLNFVDKLLRKTTKIPFSTSQIISFQNIQKLLNSDILFLVNETVSFSLLPLLVYIKKFKKIEVNIFLMGISVLKQKNFLINKLQNFAIKILFNCSTNIYFLGEGEKKYCENHFPKFIRKIKYIPFSVDVNFWNEEINNDIQKRNGVLFVGNDLNRDYELLLQIASEISELEFTFVTQQIIKNENLPKNIKILNSDMYQKIISDVELRSVYKSSKLVILPLKNTLQPSGQSVALQSMSCSTPVLISNTVGLWDKTNLVNNENIFLIEPNTLENWVKKIREYYPNDVLLNKVSQNALINVKSSYNLESFYSKLSKDILI